MSNDESRLTVEEGTMPMASLAVCDEQSQVADEDRARQDFLTEGDLAGYTACVSEVNNECEHSETTDPLHDSMKNPLDVASNEVSHFAESSELNILPISSKTVSNEEAYLTKESFSSGTGTDVVMMKPASSQLHTDCAHDRGDAHDGRSTDVGNSRSMGGAGDSSPSSSSFSSNNLNDSSAQYVEASSYRALVLKVINDIAHIKSKLYLEDDLESQGRQRKGSVRLYSEARKAIQNLLMEPLAKAAELQELVESRVVDLSSEETTCDDEGKALRQLQERRKMDSQAGRMAPNETAPYVNVLRSFTIVMLPLLGTLLKIAPEDRSTSQAQTVRHLLENCSVSRTDACPTHQKLLWSSGLCQAALADVFLDVLTAKRRKKWSILEASDCDEALQELHGLPRWLPAISSVFGISDGNASLASDNVSNEVLVKRLMSQLPFDSTALRHAIERYARAAALVRAKCAERPSPAAISRPCTVLRPTHQKTWSPVPGSVGRRTKNMSPMGVLMSPMRSSSAGPGCLLTRREAGASPSRAPGSSRNSPTSRARWR
eukprot:TRINITY_DN51495_c0_g1_i1.p1 TRINITY_DN51495_c0_g1~~TRINITY_DN51495_c0_g1_i1.p1  ORF type:complete len:546 (-),score=95.79 TRINITY_DN51495_c0_g1_i1:20-1657(-)